MKLPAILAAFTPWIVGVFSYLTYLNDIVTLEGFTMFPWLWIVISPVWFAAGCLVAYREGQWSIKENG